MSEEEIYNYLDLKSKEMTLVYGDNIVIAIKMLLDTNFIKKSVIRNKIKELGEIKGDLATYIAVTEKMKILKELLGE